MIELLTVVLLALGVSLGLNRVMLTLGPRLGLMDEPGERRIHARAIPRAGGIAIWLTFLLVIGGGLATGWLQSHGGSLSWLWLGAFAAGSGVLMVAGFIDDRRGLSPWLKLAAHVLAPSVFFVLHPARTGIIPLDWPVHYDFMLFVGWSVVLINAFNLIDGLDGLCGGLAAVASLSLAGLAWANGRLDAAVLLLVMGAAILGFLWFNFNPARIFLGDAGSMLVGFFLATAATDAVGRKAVVGVILLPIAVAGVPLVDVLLAIWRRTARRFLRRLDGEENGAGGGIFDADSDHLHHRLLKSGGSQRKVAVLLQAIAIILAVLAFLPLAFGDRMLGLSLVGFLIVGLVGIRNLARVEMEHTGSVIHMAIKLPGQRRRTAVLLFIYDMLVLTAAAVSAILIETNRLVRVDDMEPLLRFGLLFVILGAISLLVARVHDRLWVRVTIRDLLSMQLWLLVGAIATFSLYSLIYVDLGWSTLRLTITCYALSVAGVTLPRVALDLLREFGLEARHRNQHAATSDGYGPTVVLGAGDLGTLLLLHLKSSSSQAYPGMRLLGFLDAATPLHGRMIRSFRILGDLSAIPKLVAEAGLRSVIVAINQPSRELQEELADLADQHDLQVYQWEAGLRER